MKKDALISGCNKYRYCLGRYWDDTKGNCLFIMLNPSIADASIDDPTIKRCISYAKLWDYGSVEVVNLFSYRSTDKSQLRKVENPVGADTDKFILKHAKNSDFIVCAWGNDGKLNGRSKKVINLLKSNGFEIHYLKLTNKGEPGHPLYLKKELLPKKL